MSFNRSLTNFKLFARFYAIASLVLIVLGLFFILIANAPSSHWTDGVETYSSLGDCEYANSGDSTFCESVTVTATNFGMLITSYVAFGLGAFAANLALISRFLLMTTDSLLEGLGGNFTVDLSKRKASDEVDPIKTTQG